MLFNLLSNSSGANANKSGSWTDYIFPILLLAGIVLFMVLSRQSQKKKQQEAMDMLNAIQPGNKVKTIGGICGVVVEVCPEDNTFILETGSETSGKSYLKFDKQAVYQTDAVTKNAETAPAEEETVAPQEEVFEEVATPAEETTAENENPAETTEE